MLTRPSLDDLRALRPDLSLALFAMDPGQGVTLEIYHDGVVYPFTGATVAEAILCAFPPAPSPGDKPVGIPLTPATPDNVFD